MDWLFGKDDCQDSESLAARICLRFFRSGKNWSGKQPTGRDCLPAINHGSSLANKKKHKISVFVRGGTIHSWNYSSTVLGKKLSSRRGQPECHIEIWDKFNNKNQEYDSNRQKKNASNTLKIEICVLNGWKKTYKDLYKYDLAATVESFVQPIIFVLYLSSLCSFCSTPTSNHNHHYGLFTIVITTIINSSSSASLERDCNNCNSLVKIIFIAFSPRTSLLKRLFTELTGHLLGRDLL